MQAVEFVSNVLRCLFFRSHLVRPTSEAAGNGCRTRIGALPLEHSPVDWYWQDLGQVPL